MAIFGGGGKGSEVHFCVPQRMAGTTVMANRDFLKFLKKSKDQTQIQTRQTSGVLVEVSHIEPAFCYSGPTAGRCHFQSVNALCNRSLTRDICLFIPSVRSNSTMVSFLHALNFDMIHTNSIV